MKTEKKKKKKRQSYTILTDRFGMRQPEKKVNCKLYP